MALCSICLRTNIILNEVDQGLISFYDDLLEYEVFPNRTLCENCVRLLKKCNDFKQLCQTSNRIFQDWKINKIRNAIESLHSLIQPFYNEVFENEINNEVFKINYEKQNETTKNIIDTTVPNNDNLIPNNYEMEYNQNEVENNYNDVEVKLENIVENNVYSYLNNDVLTETIEEIIPFEIKKEMDLNLRDNKDNRIEDSDNEDSDNEDYCVKNNSDNNRIENNSHDEKNIIRNNDNECNRMGDNINNEDYRMGNERSLSSPIMLSSDEDNRMEDDSDNNYNEVDHDNPNGINNDNYNRKDDNSSDCEEVQFFRKLLHVVKKRKEMKKNETLVKIESTN